MASSPDEPPLTEEPWSPDDERVPKPWLAIVAIAVAVVTLLVGLGAAVYAGFFLDAGS